MKLDLLDKKIIYELGKDSRVSYKELARKIGSKKEVVAYRINNLIKEKIITKFVPVFSLSRLGIFSGKIYINLKGMKDKEKIIDELAKKEKIAWIAKSVGRWDLLIGFYYRNIIEFGKIKDEIVHYLGEYIQDYDVALIEDGLVFNREYLIEKEKFSRKEFVFGGNISEIKIDEVDKKIITLIKNNARFEYIEIAKKLNVDARTILSRLKNLKDKEVLQGYTVFLDLNKINYKLYKICIHLDNSEKNSISNVVEKLKLNPNVLHIIKSISNWEIEAEIEYENIEKIYDYINNLKDQMPQFIRKIDFVTINQEIKLDFFPQDLI